MPFSFEPLSITHHEKETVLRGRVVAGAYYGPEAAVVRSTAGEELTTHIDSHVLEYPAGWPVLPEHEKTTLVLSIPLLPPGFELAQLIGVGGAAKP